jgi:undecaprenyl-diphosphatase
MHSPTSASSSNSNLSDSHLVSSAKINKSGGFKFSKSQALILLKATLSLFLILCVLLITQAISSPGEIQAFDESILRWVETLRTPFLNMMMVDVTSLGGLALTVVLGLLISTLFVLAKDPSAAVHLILTAAGGFAISIWSKGLVARPRPSIIPQLIHASGFSYPSGHSITSAAIYLTMAILGCRHFKSHLDRVILLGLAAAMITLISFSRIYLGVHYPSDTFSGALIGMAWALFTASLFSKIHFSDRYFMT